MSSVFVVKLNELYPNCIDIAETVVSEERIFSSRKEAESWLFKNGFRIGQRCFLKYSPEDGCEWIRRDDVYWNYIDVTIQEYELDDYSNSIFKNHTPRMSPQQHARHFDIKGFNNKTMEFKSMEEYQKQLQKILVDQKHAESKKQSAGELLIK